MLINLDKVITNNILLALGDTKNPKIWYFNNLSNQMFL